MEVVIAAVVIALALVAAPAVVTVLILRYISSMPYRNRVGQLLDGLVEFRFLASAVAEAVKRQHTPAVHPRSGVPDSVIEFALHESEPWARDSIIARARQLFVDYDDGRSSPEQLWGQVLNRLAEEAGGIVE